MGDLDGSVVLEDSIKYLPDQDTSYPVSQRSSCKDAKDSPSSPKLTSPWASTPSRLTVPLNTSVLSAHPLVPINAKGFLYASLVALPSFSQSCTLSLLISPMLKQEHAFRNIKKLSV